MGMINVIRSALGMRALTKLLPRAPGVSNNDIVPDCVRCREQSLTKHGTEKQLAPWVLVSVTAPEVKCHDLPPTQS